MSDVEEWDPAEWDPAFEAYERGVELHRRGRHRAQAEAEYRRAIIGGYDEASLNLGLLMAGTGRTDEEEAAYRTAMGCDDDEIASRAALLLGNLLDNLRGDPAGARTCFEVARDRGIGATRLRARSHLAFSLALQGDREAAEKELAAFVDERFPEDDGNEFHATLARTAIGVARSRAIRRLLRALRVSMYRVRRRVRALRVAWLGSP